ncbi:MAG: hypothetical protein WCP85_29110 [Mariniphaga sp.]
MNNSINKELGHLLLVQADHFQLAQVSAGHGNAEKSCMYIFLMDSQFIGFMVTLEEIFLLQAGKVSFVLEIVTNAHVLVINHVLERTGIVKIVITLNQIINSKSKEGNIDPDFFKGGNPISQFNKNQQ